MQYRKFGKLEWPVSLLGFGCMRLPSTDGRGFSANVDEKQSLAMMRRAIDEGVNYFDTAYAYHMGQSEIILGKALQDGYRRKVRVATKAPVWLMSKAEDFDAFLAEQLQRLKTDHIDFYLLHGLDQKRWREAQRLNLLARAEAAIGDGRIGHIGFSFHDTFAAFREIVTGYPGWTLCQVQYNYMDIGNQAGTAGVRMAAASGLAVVVMEPVLGGRLANPPPEVRRVFSESGFDRSYADWALQWVFSQPEVALALSGMSSPGQLEENLRSAERARVGLLTPAELQMLDEVRKKFLERTPIPCTACGYCMPCPNGVDIPKNFESYNGGVVYDDWAIPRLRYNRLFADKEKADMCVQCRECEEKCPQKIAISGWLPKVHKTLVEPPGKK